MKCPDFFCTIYPFFRNFTKILDQKKRFFSYRGHFDPPKKGVKRVFHVLFLKVHRLDLPHPKYWPPIINRGKVIQMGGFYTATPPHMCLVAPCSYQNVLPPGNNCGVFVFGCLLHFQSTREIWSNFPHPSRN